MLYDTPENVMAELEERWSGLTLANDFVFCKAMSNPDLCREVLEAILGWSIEKVEYVRSQDQIDATPESKSVRLDVYVRDGRGTVYNVEMQSTDTRELARRSRYYQSLMALDQIRKGEPYRLLKDSYVIFICGFDPFGRGSRVYSFESRCAEIGDLALGDGAKTIFLASTVAAADNAGGRLNEFLDYVSSGEVSGELSAKLDSEVGRVLDNKKWRLEYMLLEVRDQLNYDRGREEGLNAGRLTGLAEGREAGLAEGREAGLAEGREAGLAEGRLTGLAEGRETGLAEGHTAGLTQGREIGLAEGERRMAELFRLLTEAGRGEDLARAFADNAYRAKLCDEFGITR